MRVTPTPHLRPHPTRRKDTDPAVSQEPASTRIQSMHDLATSTSNTHGENVFNISYSSFTSCYVRFHHPPIPFHKRPAGWKRTAGRGYLADARSLARQRQQNHKITKYAATREIQRPSSHSSFVPGFHDPVHPSVQHNASLRRDIQTPAQPVPVVKR